MRVRVVQSADWTPDVLRRVELLDALVDVEFSRNHVAHRQVGELDGRPLRVLIARPNFAVSLFMLP